LFIQGRRRQLQAGRAGSEKATELVLQRIANSTPGPAVLEGTVISAQQWRALDRQRDAIWFWVGLAAVAHVLRNLHLDKQAILRLIVLTAVIRTGQKKLAHALMRLVECERR
jgi:RsiW-degrading membrane proteinase PrsW (M82 family)